MVEIEGCDCTPRVGSIVEPDNWRLSQLLTASDWEAAQFYLPTGHDHGVKRLAVNIMVTGRTLRRRYGNEYWVRIRIEFVGDGEPSTFHSGWLKNPRS